MKPVLIVGGGISGLSMAYWLTKQGVPVQLIEKSSRFGGLIQTHVTDYGLVETAANGFLADDDILKLCEDVGVPLAHRKPDRKKRFIFRQAPQRWPLKINESFKFLRGLLRMIFKRRQFFQINSFETLSSWTERNLSKPVLDWLVAPGLQGVYAGNPDRLSATLILGGFGKKIRRQTKIKGTLAPEQGMGQLINCLVDWLTEREVSMSLNRSFQIEDFESFSKIVVSTSSFDLEDLHLDQLRGFSVEPLPLVSATLFFEPDVRDLKGFGCLFPRREGFYSLGVLFNDCIFEGRSQKRSETWILGGAFHKQVCNFSDDEILRQILADRGRLYKLNSTITPLEYKVTRWPKALPHFDVHLEKKLSQLGQLKNIYLSGNYLGRIGLSQIISRNRSLSEEIKRDLDHG